MTLNKAMLIGRLTRDPEMRFTSNGTGVVTFSVATDNGYGENKTTEFHNIVAWGKRDGTRGLADTIVDYARKGTLVYIEGRLQTRSWEDGEGNKRRATEIILSHLQLLSPKGNSEEPGLSMEDAEKVRQQAISGVDPDDIPF
jgi:single-strand DNA-binding protein